MAGDEQGCRQGSCEELRELKVGSVQKIKAKH
jgi:hypothetical protein